MSDITEAVAKAIAAEMDNQWGDAAFDDSPAFDHAAISRAAIEAYEAEKAKQSAWAEKLGKDSIRRFQENNR